MKKGWEYKKLGEVCDIVGGGTPNTKIKEYWNGNIPWATVSDMNCDKLQSTGYYITDRGLKESSSRIIKRGEIIIATRVGLGKVCKLSIDTAINQDLKGVIPKNESIIRNFIFYYFKHKARYIVDNGIGATVKGVKIKFIEGLLFGYPPLSEQQSIVDYLDSAFAKIDAMKANAEKALNEAKALFQASLKEMLEPKEGWEEKTLKEIVHPDCSLSYGIVQPGEHVKDGVPVVRPVDFNDKVIVRAEGLKRTKREISDAYKRTILKGGEILLCVRGTTGTMGLASDELQGCNVTRGIVPIFFGDNVNKMFVYYQLLSPKLQREIQKKTTGAALKQINIKDLRAILLMFPPISEQHSIATSLDSLKSKVDRLQANYEKISQECDALKQAILRQVFE